MGNDPDDELRRHLDAGDPIKALGAALREAGARVTFDPERSIAKPCIVCGTTDQPRDLVQIGTWTRRIGGHVRGDKITRPMCASCEMQTRGSWLVISEWRPAGECPQCEVETEAASHRDAYLQGRQMACCRGALAVRVVAPDGMVGHKWSRTDNVWRDYVPPPEES